MDQVKKQLDYFMPNIFSQQTQKGNTKLDNLSKANGLKTNGLNKTESDIVP